MKVYTLICKYCNHSWKIWNLDLKYAYSCGNCQSKDLKAVEHLDVYGYDSNEPKEDAWVKRSNK